MDYSVPHRQELLEQGIINRQFKQNPYQASSISSSSDRNEPHFMPHCSTRARFYRARYYGGRLSSNRIRRLNEHNDIILGY